ncbi:hypothetical protein [Paracoccus xiamenensis]|uniref:hypothetical protein n=1 Tax=Paracoccus xiamenensis TaxID=2714901 RepID=UPI00140D0571|nr:hypothetical protein [Paracoccus xiamenensis]NHF72467.1 hypothetical protein [Paracoccus xiamenensis]
MAIRALPALSGLISLLALAGCGDPSGDYPALLPTDRLLAEPSIPGHAGIAATSPDQVVSDLTSAGAALSVSQSQVTAADVTDDAALAARAEALRAKAAALSAETPACPDPTSADC